MLPTRRGLNLQPPDHQMRHYVNFSINIGVQSSEIEKIKVILTTAKMFHLEQNTEQSASFHVMWKESTSF